MIELIAPINLQKNVVEKKLKIKRSQKTGFLEQIYHIGTDWLEGIYARFMERFFLTESTFSVCGEIQSIFINLLFHFIVKFKLFFFSFNQ